MSSKIEKFELEMWRAIMCVITTHAEGIGFRDIEARAKEALEDALAAVHPHKDRVR